MSTDIKISEIVDRIREDVCTDCKNKCGLCAHGLCQDVIIEVGCFFVNCASVEKRKQ